MTEAAFASIDALTAALAGQGYVCGEGLATAVFLGARLERPVFLEGEAGVGKTEIAKAVAAATGRRLIRLQCYEGVDAAAAAYEWNYAAQMLEIRLAEARGDMAADGGAQALAKHLYSEAFLIRRPLLEALASDDPLPPVLLIDEIDRADAPFEAFLLEALSDHQITIPEYKTVQAERPPLTFLTSNRTREVHDALKRRCLYHWVDYPSLARELEILQARLPDAPADLSRAAAAFVQSLRGEDLFKKPGVAESIDWARALLALDSVALTPETISNSMGALLKHQDDIARMQRSDVARVLQDAERRLAAVEI